MGNKVIKNFHDKTDENKLYEVKNKEGKSDVYESKDSKRIAFLVQEGFVEEEKEKMPEPKKGKSSKKAGE